MVSLAAIFDRFLAVAIIVTLLAMPSAAHAERWWGTGEICMDLDSVHISNTNGTRYVTFHQRLCKGSGELWWAIADSDCEKAHGKNASAVELYVYDADTRQWQGEEEHFMMSPSSDDSEHKNAGVACNWAHPGLF